MSTKSSTTTKGFRENKESGLSNQNSLQGGRMVNGDGSFNVQKRGMHFWDKFSPFHYLTTISWKLFFLISVGFFIVCNLIFASLYYAAGLENIGGLIGQTAAEKFLEAFFFSCQTFTTVGYGRVNPTGFATNLVASFEALFGVLSFSITTGLLYGRFSRPVSKMIYSSNMLISPYKDITGMMFRVANALPNTLIEMEVKVSVGLKIKENGNWVRRFFFLETELKKIDFMILSWTIVHPIDEKSPLWGLNEKDLEESEAEFIVLLSGIDETYGQQVYSRFSYKPYQFKWNAKFKPMFHPSEDGTQTVLELDKINEFEMLK
ncbi:MAG: hypothetical protein K1X82_09410 [Bacteroidia bacterium]|nr:hypothetical protein [Bacteroidia bacterium]